MNPNSTNISNWLESETTISPAENHLKSNPDFSFAVNNIPVRLDESIELYNFLKELILQTISTGLLEKLPTTLQAQIHNQIQAIVTHRANINQTITQIQSLYYHVLLAGLEKKLDNFDNYKRALTNISNLRRNYTKTINGLEDIIKKVKKIESNYDKSQALIEKFSIKRDELEKSLIKSESDLLKSSEIFKDIESSQQEITNSKKEIIAFQANIESYKKDIADKTIEANRITENFENQQGIVDKLISDAEKALQLKSSQGLSAALSTQYDNENNFEKKKYWLISAGFFILLSLLGVLMLIFNIEFEHFKVVNNGINSVVARVVFVGITITGATFCANQFTKQKQIADNYGYKLVLAKSIVAFAQEIKKHSPSQASEYMKDVLDEINKSPISKIKDEGLTTKDIGLFQKIADTFMQQK